MLLKIILLEMEELVKSSEVLLLQKHVNHGKNHVVHMTMDSFHIVHSIVVHNMVLSMVHVFLQQKHFRR